MSRETGRATNEIAKAHKAGLGARDAFNHETGTYAPQSEYTRQYPAKNTASERPSSIPTPRTRILQPTRVPLAQRSASAANIAASRAASPGSPGTKPSSLPRRRPAAQNGPQVARVPGLDRH
jgi:hypothetical protein